MNRIDLASVGATEQFLQPSRVDDARGRAPRLGSRALPIGPGPRLGSMNDLGRLLGLPLKAEDAAEGQCWPQPIRKLSAARMHPPIHSQTRGREPTDYRRHAVVAAPGRLFGHRHLKAEEDGVASNEGGRRCRFNDTLGLLGGLVGCVLLALQCYPPAPAFRIYTPFSAIAVAPRGLTSHDPIPRAPWSSRPRRMRKSAPWSLPGRSSVHVVQGRLFLTGWLGSLSSSSECEATRARVISLTCIAPRVAAPGVGGSQVLSMWLTRHREPPLFLRRPQKNHVMLQVNQAQGLPCSIIEYAVMPAPLA